MNVEKLASAIYNDVVGGLRGYHTNVSISMELLEDEIVEERLAILKEYSLKGILPLKDLYTSINCINVDCKDLERCKCGNSSSDLTPNLHFEIPQIVNDYGDLSISYIGSTDRMNSFLVYTTPEITSLHKYRKRGKDKPWVWIDIAPNANNMLDCFVFNAPLLSQVSVVAIFKDTRLLEGCCDVTDNVSFIDSEIKKRLTERKIKYYRLLASLILPNDLKYQP